jgi:hypothetical protein
VAEGLHTGSMQSKVFRVLWVTVLGADIVWGAFMAAAYGSGRTAPPELDLIGVPFALIVFVLIIWLACADSVAVAHRHPGATPPRSRP